MKKLVVLVLVILLAPLASQAAPSLVFDDASLQYDFGTVTEGDVLEHTFSFTNTGRDELRIEKIHPS